MKSPDHYFGTIQSELVDGSGTSAPPHEIEMCKILCRIATVNSGTYGHNLSRMAELSGQIALWLGHPAPVAHVIGVCAMLHDIGKVSVPNHILLKPGKLDQDEMATVREHARLGHSLLNKGESDLMKLAAAAALHHHERFDGGGYPDGLKNAAIPWHARIVAITDVIDSMSSERPYRSSIPPMFIKDYIDDQKGKNFDPEIVDVVINHWSHVYDIIENVMDYPNP